MTREARRAELLSMLTYMRPSGSKHELKFIARYLKPLKLNIDLYGNLIKKIKNPDGSEPNILWSCHTDTVHRSSSRQQVFVSQNQYAYTNSGECLGADCTTGVWIMRHMILAKIPGLYIFHRDEEIGRKGSTWIADKNPKLLENIKFAIAFDRKGLDSIITKQMGSKCCSSEFSKSLNAALGNRFKDDPGGSYTDTASYTKIVPECTNISVGYYQQHTKNEVQDLIFADWLLETILEADFSQLVEARDPKAVEVSHHNYAGYGGYGRYGLYDDYDYDNIGSYTRSRPTKVLSKIDQLRDLVFEHPDAVADLLDAYGISPDDIRSYIWGSQAA